MTKVGISHWADIIVVVIYFVLVLAVGLWTLWRPNRSSVAGYFLAGRSITWFPVGASLFASNIGSEHFIGLAGAGAASGIAIGLYELMSLPLVLMLAWLFIPVYISADVYTLPEYMSKRYGSQRLRIYLSTLSLVLYVVTKVVVSIYAGSLFIQLALGWDMYASIAALLVVTCIYTVLGGLAAVIYTDAIQTVIMMLGAVILCVISFIKVGGYENLQRLYNHSYPSQANTSCGRPHPHAFHLFRDPLYSDNPWPGMLLQTSIGCLWYWCCDQVIVQRALAAKSLTHAKGGALVAGYLKLLPLFLIVLPGMISRALYPDEVGCVDPEICEQVCGNAAGCSNVAYPTLVIKLLPPGARGLLLAVMISAIVSSLTSIFNSASAVFTMDLWRRLRPQSSEKELLIVGRLFVVIMCAVSILWIPLVKSSQGGQLFIYIQTIQGYLGTPVGALFLWSLLWKRATEKGAFCGIIGAHIAGVIRMVLDFVYPTPACEELDTRPLITKYVHYTYFGPFLLILTSVIIVAVSLCTEPQDEVRHVTWGTRWKPSEHVNEDMPMETLNKNAAPDAVPSPPNNRSVFKRWLYIICGLPDKKTTVAATSSSDAQKEKYLTENKKWKRFLDFNAVFGLVVVAFIIGFFH